MCIKMKVHAGTFDFVLKRQLRWKVVFVKVSGEEAKLYGKCLFSYLSKLENFLMPRLLILEAMRNRFDVQLKHENNSLLKTISFFAKKMFEL